MTSAAPKNGVYGKRDPKNAPALSFARYDRLSQLSPEETALKFPAVDYLSRVSWSGTMNGNDRAGDCVSCGVVNLVLLLSTLFTGTGIRATLAEVIKFYKTQNPDFDINGDPNVNGPGSSADNGMDEQTALEELRTNGIEIGGQTYKIVAFAKLDHTNLQEIKNAISILGVVLLGVQVAAAQQDQFPNVWSYVADSPIEGGHAIIAGGHADKTSDDVKAECWASEFGTTDQFLEKQLDEAWAVLTPWHMGSQRLIEGMDLATFASDFTQITGDPFPVPVEPTPAPTPAPAPEPTPEPSPPPVVRPDPPVVTEPPVNEIVELPDEQPQPVAITGTATAGFNIWVDGHSYDQATEFSLDALTSSDGTFTVTSPPLAKGDYTVQVTQCDPATPDNVSPAASVSFSVVQSDPVPTPPEPTPDPTPVPDPVPPVPDAVPDPTVDSLNATGSDIAVTGTGVPGNNVIAYGQPSGALFGGAAPISPEGNWGISAPATDNDVTLLFVQRTPQGSASPGVTADIPAPAPQPAPAPVPDPPPTPTPPEPVPPPEPVGPDAPTRHFARQLLRWLEHARLSGQHHDIRFREEAEVWLITEELINEIALSEDEG